MDIEHVYKYCALTDYALKNIKDDTVAFTHIKSLNDPLEAIVRINFNEECRSYFDSIGKVDVLDEIGKCDDIHEGILREFRVLSLSLNNNNPLMWAHYASGHHGICIEYDVNDILKTATSVQKISYGNSLPWIGDNTVNLNEFLFHKSLAWEYENEIRAIYQFSSEDATEMADYEVVKAINNQEFCATNECFLFNNKIYSFPKVVIKQCRIMNIYFGINTDEQAIKEVRALAQNREIGLYKMKFEDSSYKLTAQPIV